LSLGKIGNTIGHIGETTVFSSENSAFSIISAEKVRDIEPNEMVIATPSGVSSIKIRDKKPKNSQCVFELIYFAKPSSSIFNKSVYEYRFEIGRRLAKEFPVDADYVVPVPDSGIVSALGYSDASGIPMAMGLIRSHYIGRTFIEPSQKIRDFGVKLKFIPVKEIIEGKRIILIDDSIVRGTTSRKIVKMIRDFKASEIHVRISSPPVKFPCYYGIDFSTYEELLANKLHTFEEIAKFIGSDTVGYLSTDGLFDESDLNPSDFCKACFDGQYPTELSKFTKSGFENDIKEKNFGRKNGIH